MRRIVFDIETSNIFTDIGKNDPAGLDLAVVGIHDSENDSYTCYTQGELQNLWPTLEKTDMLIGWNSNHFDIPLLNKYYPGDLLAVKSLDLMHEVKKTLGKRLSLNSVAEATLGLRKSGSGLESLSWWKKGEYEKVKNYCLDDVRITKELYEYAKKNSHLKFKDFGLLREIKLDPSDWEKMPDKGSLTHTLPF